MSTQRKITISFFDRLLVRRTGLPLTEAATQLGIWKNKTESELKKYFTHWLDINKFRLSAVWTNRTKGWRLFEAGYSITEQLDTAINKLASETTEDISLDWHHVMAVTQFFREAKLQTQDSYLTFYSNIRSSWLPTLADTNYWTTLLADPKFNERTAPPILPSALGTVFKAGFNADTVLP